jgi:hypothetical protein
MNHEPECIWWDTVYNLVGACNCKVALGNRSKWLISPANAKQIESEAYQRGYDLGYKHGLQDGRR